MYYLKLKNYTRFCVLAGCLFSVKVLVDIVHTQETANVYKLAGVEKYGQKVMAVDPLDSTVEVNPFPTYFMPQKNSNKD